MLKHHRYGTGYLMESGGRSDLPGAAVDIGQILPSDWRAVSKLPKPDIDFLNKPNVISKMILEALKELPLTVYVKGSPSGGPVSDVAHLKNPSSLQQFTDSTEAVISAGYPPNGYTVFLGGPDDTFIKHLIDVLYVAIGNAGEKKIKPADVQRAISAHAKQKYRPHVSASIDLGIMIKESPTYSSSKAYTRFDLHQRGYNIIGHALGYADEALPSQVITDAQLDNSMIGKYRKEITQAILSIYYHRLWLEFKTFVFKHQRGVNAAFEKGANKMATREAYDTAKGKAAPETHPKPENTSRQRGPNPVLYPAVRRGGIGGKVDTREVPREARGPFVKVSGSIRGTGDTSVQIVTASESERQWQNAQGFIVSPGPLPREAGAWVPSERIRPLYNSPDHEAYYGLYYDHPLLKPTSTAQVYWYGNKNHVMTAARQYGKMTNDMPPVAVRVIDKTTNRAITLRQLKMKKGKYGMRDYEKINKIIHNIQNSAKEGKRQWLPKLRTFLGSHITKEKLEKAWNDMSDKPGKKGEHPEGVDAKKWAEFVRYVRGEGERTLGLKFSAQLPGSKFSGKRKFLMSRHEIPGIQRFRQNMQLSGERDKDGKPAERWGIYLIEFIQAHKTYGTSPQTYMIPVNIIRADDDLPPRNARAKSSKRELLDLLRKTFGKFGVSHETNWEYQNGKGAPHFIYPYLNRISVAHGPEIAKINAKLRRSQNPKIERTTFGYKIDNVEWDAYQMFVAMPPSVAEKKFGLMTRRSYSRLLVDDPGMINRISRAVGAHASRPNSLQGMGLSPRPVRAQFDLGDSEHGKGNPWDKEDLSKVDLTFGKSYTKIPPGYFASKMGDRWEPIIEHRLNDIGRVLDTFVAGFQRANSYEAQGKLWVQHVQKIKHQAMLGESELTNLLAAMQQVDMSRASRLGKDLYANIRTYIRYSKKVINSDTGEYIMVPKVVEALGLSKYDAPFATIGFRNVEMSVKAPSEEVAKLMFALKLLRRSATNRTLGKAMNIRSVEGKFQIIPDLHTRIMAQWKNAGYPVVADHEPGHIRRVITTNIIDRHNIERSKPGGIRKFARMLRLN